MTKRPKPKIKITATQKKVRPEVIAHFRRSVVKNRKLYELLAKN